MKTCTICNDEQCYICGKGISTKPIENSKWDIGKKRTAHQHHIIPRFIEETDRTVWLCTLCHGAIHTHYRQEALRIMFIDHLDFFDSCLAELCEDKTDG